MQRVIPTLRVTDFARSRAFYESLGFVVEWEQPDSPVFAGISREGIHLHLSERGEDGQPGGLVHLYVDNLDAWPALEDEPRGKRELRLRDPDGNQLCICLSFPRALRQSYLKQHLAWRRRTYPEFEALEVQLSELASFERVEALTALGEWHEYEGRTQRALECNQAAWECWEREVSNDLPPISAGWNAISLCRDLRRDASRLAWRERMARTAEPGPLGGPVLFQNALEYANEGDQERSGQSYQAALAWLRAHGKGADSFAGTVMTHYAEALRSWGEDEEAAELEARARAIEEKLKARAEVRRARRKRS